VPLTEPAPDALEDFHLRSFLARELLTLELYLALVGNHCDGVGRADERAHGASHAFLIGDDHPSPERQRDRDFHLRVQNGDGLRQQVPEHLLDYAHAFTHMAFMTRTIAT